MRTPHTIPNRSQARMGPSGTGSAASSSSRSRSSGAARSCGVAGCLAFLIVAAASARASGQAIFWSRSGTSVPYSATWNAATLSWGAATALPTLGATGYWMQAARPAKGNNIIFAATDSAGACSIEGDTTGTFGARSTLATGLSGTTARQVAVAYEQMSGVGGVLYATSSSDTIDYRTITGSTLGTATTVFANIPGKRYGAARLATKPSANELVAMSSATNNDLHVRVWNGSSWGTDNTLSYNVQSPSEESYAAAYERTSGDGLIVYAQGGSSTPYSRTYLSGAWSAATTMTACSNVPQYVRLSAKVGSDEIACGMLDNNTHVRVYIWNGSSWASSLEITTTGGYNDRRTFDLAYSPDGTKALVVYSNNTSTPQYRTYSGGSWSAATSMTNMGGTPQWVQVVPGRSGSEIFITISDSNLGLNTWRWDGTTMGTMATLETNLGGSGTTEQFWLLGPKLSPSITSWQGVNPNP